MKVKLSLISVILLVIISLTYFVSGQTPVPTQQQVQKVLPKENPLETRIFKLEMKVQELERRIETLENKMRNEPR